MKNLLVTIKRNGKTNKLVMREDDFKSSSKVVGSLHILNLSGRRWTVEQVDSIVY